jgi:prolyl-tRNA synthetase
MTPGAKYYEWEGRGAPFRLELGPRDIASGTAMLARRTGGKKEPVALDGIAVRMRSESEQMQRALFEAARTRREAASIRGATREQFLAHLEGSGGFIYGGWCGDPKCESEIKEQTKATIRVLPDVEFRSPETPASCMWCGRPSIAEAMWARAY